MKRIIVIDDDRNINEFVTRILATKLNCNVTSVFNGIDAFSELNKNDFDLIILDISMPLIHGIEILEIIKQDKRLKDIPVAMLTANREKEIITKLINLGILDFIAKPITLDVVHKKLQDIIEKIDETKTPLIENFPVEEENIKFLVVDTREDIRDEIYTELSSDYKVFTTDSGIEALKIYFRETPMNIYLGINLPILNENLLAKTIRKIERQKKANIIVCREDPKLSEEERNTIDAVVGNSTEKGVLAKNILNRIK